MQLEYSERALDDIERLADFLREAAPEAADATGDIIADALQILPRHPFIGRPFGGELRELVISRGRSGYIALYHVDDEAGQVLVLAIRHQRESGYHPSDL